MCVCVCVCVCVRVHVYVCHLNAFNRDVGFGVSAFIAMNKAHHLLKPYLIEETSSDDKNETIVKPDTTLPGVFELAFYSNQVGQSVC